MSALSPAHELRELRAALKKAGITQLEIANATGKSAGWIGQCLRGHYPYFGANGFPWGIARYIRSRGFAVSTTLTGEPSP